MKSAAQTRETFRFPIRVYYEDTDAAGVVNYANHLRFMERTRTECLGSLGFDCATFRPARIPPMLHSRLEALA